MIKTNTIKSNDNGSSSRRRGKTTEEGQRSASHHHKQTKTNENSRSNGNVRSSTLKRGKSNDDGVRRAQSPASQEHQPDQTDDLDESNDNGFSPRRRGKTSDEGQETASHQHKKTKTNENSRSNGNVRPSTFQRGKSTDDGLRRAQSPASQEHQPDQTDDIDEDSSRYDGNSFDLNKLLKSDVCADVVSYYEENGRFDVITQKKFMRIMRDQLLKGPRVSNQAISRISNDVCMVFLTEAKVDYFDKQPGLTPTGIFYNMYRNKLKKPQSNPRKRKAEDLPNVEVNDLDAFSDAIKESVNYFKTFNDESNSELVYDHWTASYSYRRTALRKKTYNNVTYILENWPVMTTNYGYHLLNLDFKKEHGPLCAESLVSNWSDLARITDDLHSMIAVSNKKIRHSIAKLPSKDTMYDSIVLAKALHYLLPPRATSTTGLKFTPTMEESQRAFYQFATGPSNLEIKINERKEHWRINNIEPHPMIFGVNTDSIVRYVVVIRELRFWFNDFMNAFDAAFKTFHFFNIPYPPESILFWRLINALMYQVNTNERFTGNMNSTIQSLKAYMDKGKKASPSRRRRSTSSPARSTPSSRSSSPICVSKQ